MPVHYRAWQRTLAPYGIEFTEDQFYAWGGVPTREIIGRLSRASGVSLNVEEVTAERDQRFVEMARHIHPIERVVEIARAHRGRVPLAVATGGTQQQVDVVLRSIGVWDWFDVIVSADDVDRGKPAPDVFLEAARRLRVVPSQCVVYEDAEAGLQGARAAGMTVVDIRELV